MKTLFYKGEINDENVSNLILAIEEVDEDLTIYFNSEGGLETSENVLADYINNKCERRLTFVFYDEVHSSAFNLALRLKCKIEVLDGTYSIVHLYGQAFHTRDNHKTKDFYLKYLNKLNNKMLGVYKNFLKNSEIEKIKNQEDVYLCDERLRLILC